MVLLLGKKQEEEEEDLYLHNIIMVINLTG